MSIIGKKDSELAEESSWTTGSLLAFLKKVSDGFESKTITIEQLRSGLSAAFATLSGNPNDNTLLRQQFDTINSQIQVLQGRNGITIFPANSQAAMLNLSTARVADIAVRSDLAGMPYMLISSAGNGFSNINNWVPIGFELPDFDDLGDVDMSLKTNGSVPTWDAIAGRYVPSIPGTNPVTFATLTEYNAAIANKAIDPELIKPIIDSKVDKVSGKDLSENDYTDAEKEKLTALPTNPVQTISVNGGTPIVPSGGNVNIVVFRPTFQTLEEEEEILLSATSVALNNATPTETIYFPPQSAELIFPKTLQILDAGSNTNVYPVKMRIPVSGAGAWDLTHYCFGGASLPSGIITDGGIDYVEVLLEQGVYTVAKWQSDLLSIVQIDIAGGGTTPTVPAAPVATAATNVTDSGFTANSNPVSGAISYKLYVYQNGTPIAGYNPENNASPTSVVAGAGIVASTEYTYQWKATNAIGDSAFSNTITVTTSTPSPSPTLNTPFSAEPTNITGTAFRANASASDAFASLRWRVSTNAAMTAIVAGYNDIDTATNFLDVSGLTANTRYYYDVRTVSGGGGLSPRSLPATALTFANTVPHNADLACDLDFSDTSTLTIVGGRITQMTNKVDNSVYAATGDVQNSIEYVANAVNGKGVASFLSGNNGRLKGPLAVSNTNSTYFLVCKLNEGQSVADYPFVCESATLAGVNTHAAMLLYPGGIPSSRKIQNIGNFTDTPTSGHNGEIKLNQYVVYCMKFSSGATDFRINNAVYASNVDSVPSVISTQFCVGNNIAPFNSQVFASGFKFARVLVFNRALTVGEMTDVYNFLVNQFDLTKKNASGNMQYDGDSLTIFGDNNVSGASTNYPTQLNNALKSAIPTSSSPANGNYAIAGQSIAYYSNSVVGNVYMLQDAATQIDVAVTNIPWLQATICVWAGTNDLFYGGTAQDVYDDYVQYCTERRAAGLKVCVATAMPRQNAGTPIDFETKRLAFNILVRTNYQTFSDFALADVAADVRLQDPNNTTYFNADLVHLTATGNEVVAGIFYKALTKQTI